MNTKESLSTCCDFDPAAITIEQAAHVILEKTHTVTETEIVPIREALGRVLRRDAISLVDNPPNDNSAMDGYGVRAVDCHDDENATPTLKVIGKSFAGAPFAGEIKQGEAVRIMTGAKIPAGVDSVVMQEQTDANTDAGTVTINAAVKKGQNIRLQGEDITTGQAVIKAGTRLTPACIGVLATMGVTEVEVTRKIIVAIVSTGDELQAVGTTLKDGNIYDSNRYSLHALLHDPRFSVIEKGVLCDEQAHIEKAFLDTAHYADIVITTGGVSVGEADWIKDCVSKTGELIFWKAAIKPGRPITFGSVGNALFFGLPGNPVSVMVCFEKFTKLALQKLCGQKREKVLSIPAQLTSTIRKRPGRVEFQRGIMSYDDNGQLCVATTGNQGSGILSSMSTANCLIVLANDETTKSVGDIVTVEPFHNFITI
ncbi:MAG: molybdopterin molybdotransferase MoeA [Gammaproteobacteria bacterium]|nr:molybdopterin molybdotransferase MoeA [Gammaproteobacteria bacterium]